MYKPFRAAALLAFSTAALFSCSDTGAPTEATPASSATATISPDSLVKRGDYLVSTIGCDDCHSPKTMGPRGLKLDMEHRLSGYPAGRPLAALSPQVIKDGWMSMVGDLTAAAGPWGVSFASNITSDSTGIGTWSEEQFFTAIRQGKSKGIASNRMLLPPMPWQNFSKLTDTDLRAIYAYLKTTKPVRNVVPQPKAPGTM